MLSAPLFFVVAIYFYFILYVCFALLLLIGKVNSNRDRKITEIIPYTEILSLFFSFFIDKSCNFAQNSYHLENDIAKIVYNQLSKHCRCELGFVSENQLFHRS